MLREEVEGIIPNVCSVEADSFSRGLREQGDGTLPCLQAPQSSLSKPRGTVHPHFSRPDSMITRGSVFFSATETSPPPGNDGEFSPVDMVLYRFALFIGMEFAACRRQKGCVTAP